MRRLIIAFAGAALVGCGAEARNAEGVVKKWGNAVNARDWEHACELSVGSQQKCKDGLPDAFAGARLTLDGPAAQGVETKPGEEYFSFGGEVNGKAATVFVTAVPDDDGFRVRVEAIVGR
jgi:hypothetical protein